MLINLIDSILYNGQIRTLGDAQPVVTALAISGERIVACGSDAEMRALAGPGTTQLNLGGRYVLPGMTDAHLHWQMTSEMLHQVQLYNLPSRAAALERVAARVAQTPKGKWISRIRLGTGRLGRPPFPDGSGSRCGRAGQPRVSAISQRSRGLGQ